MQTEYQEPEKNEGQAIRHAALKQDIAHYTRGPQSH